jgi:hypothetical protein
MLEFLQDRASARKVWLFAVACCRRVWDLLTDEWSRTAVEVVERFVDGLATGEELQAAPEAARNVVVSHAAAISHAVAVTGLNPTLAAFAALTAHSATVEVAYAPHPENAYQVSLTTLEARMFALGLDHRDYGMSLSRDRAIRVARAPELKSQAHLVRDIFGPLPFRSVTVDPSWLGWNGGTVVQLVRSIYEERRFGDLPVLADALEDSGCSDPDILGHCRSGLDHVRGCWVVDLVLGKE